MKVVRNQKEYKYDYVLLHLKRDVRDNLKIEAAKAKLHMSEFLTKLLEERNNEDSIR